MVPESVIFKASPVPQPAFRSIAFLSDTKRVRKLLEDFLDILSSDSFTASKPRQGVRHHRLTIPGPPVFAKLRGLDPEKLAAAKEEFSTMEKAGIIRRSTSPWSSPFLRVKKNFSCSASPRHHGLTIGLGKCEFAVSKTEFLGHRLTSSGLHPLLKHTSAIQDFPPP